MLRLLLTLFRTQVARIRWWIWFAATLVFVAWISELLWLGRAGIVSTWIVPLAFAALILSYFLERKFWYPQIPPRDTKTKIVIVGAGPAGLSAAYFLRLQGYREVLVLEKLGHPGGLCRTITEDYYSFELGANYVTPAYRETLKLADEVGADLYAERPITTIDFAAPKPKYSDPWITVREGVGSLQYVRLCLKYMWLRYRLGRIVDAPGHGEMHLRADLCIPFLDWLARHKLEPLQRLFEAPITVMGYGYLHEIPAPYALKYMNVPTFAALTLKAFPWTHWVPWPKRFVMGFQRMWEKIAWQLNVRYNVTIHAIERNGEGIAVDFSNLQQVLNNTEPHRETLKFDFLILACPLSPNVLSFMSLSDEEADLFARIKSYSYCLTSFTTNGIEMERPIAAALPLPPIGKPWAITQQEPESKVFQFYSRVPQELLDRWTGENDTAREAPTSSAEDLSAAVAELTTSEHRLSAAVKEREDPIRGAIVGEVRDTIARLGGSIDEGQWYTYDRWNYFQHVEADEIRDGFYHRLENLQGVNRTFYTGALLNFELVENCIAYSKQLVFKNFKLT